MADKPDLTIEIVVEEAAAFAEVESKYDEPMFYGVTDGKTIGPYLEHKFTSYRVEKHAFSTGNSASGIDLPSFDIDIKATSIRQPQSSCSFKSDR